ncbi:MAG: LamG-like jellyroll fold domain-containing protein [Planctomycetota bacterium]
MSAAAPCSAQRVTLVRNGNSSVPLTSDDNSRREMFERLGFPTRWDRPQNSQSWWNTYGGTSLFDVVYLTANVDADALADKLRGYVTPIISESPALDDNLGFAASPGVLGSGATVDVQTAAHPITTGLSVGPTAIFNSTQPLSYLQGAQAASLANLATSSGQPSLAAIEAGGALANTIGTNSTAVTRLVRLPFGDPSIDWRELNAAGVRLMEQSVLWATANTYTPTSTLGVCVLLTEQNGTLSHQETWRVRRLTYWGWQVVLLHDGASATDYTAALATADVVYVTPLVSATDIGDKLREATCGVVYERSDFDDEMGLATIDSTITNAGGVRVRDRSHPITAIYLDNQSLGCFHYFNYTNNNWPGQAQPLARMRGTLAPDLKVICEQWSDPVLATVDTGDQLANTVGSNNTAAGRRVRMPWCDPTLDITYMVSWNHGSQLLERSLQWAAGSDTGTLIAHYRLDETSGTTAAESSANNYDGEYKGGVTQNVSPAPRALAAKFDATGEHVYAPPNADFQNLGANDGDWSIAFWIRPTDAMHTNWRNVVHIGGADANDRGPLIMLHPTNDRFHCWMSTTTIASGTGGWCSQHVDYNLWQHYVLVKSGGYLLWYVDGEFVNANVINGESYASAGHLRIGQESWWGTPDADLDDVRIYDYAISDQDAVELYTSLVAHYQLADGSGTQAVDSSVYDNTAALNGDPAWVPADGALELDGTGDYVTAPSGDQYDLDSEVTLAAWVKVADPDQNTYARLVSRKTSWTSTEGYELEYNPSLNRLTFGGKDRQQIAAFNVNLSSNWHHVAATLTSVGNGKYHGRLYVDGAERTTDVTAWSANPTTMAVDNFDQLVPNNNALGVGANPSGGDAFNGQIRDVRLYRRALSSDELFELGGSGLRLHLKLDETAGTLAADSSSFSFNAAYEDNPLLAQEGIIGTAITLDDGADFDRVEVPADAVDGMEKLAIAWWMRTDKTGESTVISGAASSGGNAANSFLLYFRRDNTFNPWIDQSTASVYSIDPISDNRWRHFVFNCDRAGGWHELYIDGELVERKTMTPKSGGFNVADGGLIIGEEQDSLGGGFITAQSLVGDLDDFRIYGRVLSPEEVAELHGLVGHWRFDELADETVATDETVFAQDGEYINTPTQGEEAAYPSPAVQTGVRCEPGQYVSISHADHLRVGDDNADFSVACWLKNNRNGGGQWRETIKKHHDGRQRTFGMWLRPSDNRMHVRISTTHSWNEGFDSLETFNVGVWRHLAYVKEGSQLKFYVDGVLDRAMTLNGSTYGNNGDTHLGVRGSTWRSDVSIDDFRVYRRALNAWEVAELHGLVGWYRMEDMAGAVVADSSGVANHAAVIGASPTWPVDAKEGTGSIELDGSNYIQAPDLPAGGPGAAIAAWVKLTEPDSSGSDVVSLGDSLAIRLDQGGAGVRAFGYNGGSWEFVDSSRSVEDTGWRHVAASFRDDTNELILYLDGVLIFRRTMSSPLDIESLATTITLGTHGTNKPNYDFTGRLDDVRVFNRPISDTEARALYYGDSVLGLRIVQWQEIANP